MEVVQSDLETTHKTLNFMPRTATTQEIPAWSANLCANAPKDWRDDLRAQARVLGMSFGELVRQLLLAGAASRLPALAEKMLVAHKNYYPKRSLRIATLSAVLLTVFVGGMLASGGHKELRAAKRPHRVREEWVQAV